MGGGLTASIFFLEGNKKICKFLQKFGRFKKNYVNLRIRDDMRRQEDQRKKVLTDVYHAFYTQWRIQKRIYNNNLEINNLNISTL